MQILFDTKILLNSSIENVWEVLTSAELRSGWQNGVSKAELSSGNAGYRGAQTTLTLLDSGKTVVEVVQRSCVTERLQTQFEIGDCSYQQIIYLNRIDDKKTQLTYHCKQIPNSGWRRILNIRPTVPACVKPDIFESLSQMLDKSSTAA